MFSFSFLRPEGAGAGRSIGRSLSGIGLFACTVALVSAGCGGGTDYTNPGDTGSNTGAIPVVTGSPARLRVVGGRALTEIAFVGSPNVTPVGADDFTFLKASATEGFDLNYPNSYTLIAPEIWADRQFKEWRLNGSLIETDNTLQLSQIPVSTGGTVSAVYEPYIPPTNAFTPNYAGNLRVLNHFPNLPIKIWVDPQLAPNQGAKDLLLAGIEKWKKASGGVIDYVEVRTSGEADIRLRSAENLLNVGAGVLGVNLSIPQADSLNNDLDFSTLWLIRAQFGVQNSTDRVSYVATVAHEFGHALGLQGHSDVDTDLMFPFSGPLEVTDRDINTVATAYRSYFDGGNTVPQKP